MTSQNLSCSATECKHKRDTLSKLSYAELCAQLDKCDQCENELFKTNLIAARTHQVIALYWAQVHNAVVGKSLGNLA